MTRWGEIKCPRCAELETLVDDCMAAILAALITSDAQAALAEKLAKQDELVQAAVAAKLREAVEIYRKLSEGSPVGAADGQTFHVRYVTGDEFAQNILALIPEDAQAALDRVVAAEQSARPIRTAPKDGTHILIAPYGNPTDLQVSWFIEGEDRWANWSWSVEPSHWFPLPVIRKRG